MKSKVKRIEEISNDIVDKAIRYEMQNRKIGEKFTVADRQCEKVKDETRKEGFRIIGVLVR